MRHSGNCKKAVKLGLRATASMAALVGAMGMAHAAVLDTGNPDITMIWGNTVRYNTGWRMDKRNDVIGNTANSDEGDYAFNRGDRVTNRWDLLTEFDFDYNRQMGFRISAAAWKESAYGGEVHTNPIFAARSSYTNNQYSSYTKRFAMGPSGEFLDAFVFSNFSLGEMPANVKIGRQTTLWGEVLSLSTHSVSYAQAPTDGNKGLSNPGIDARESALPVGQISGSLQVLPNLALLGQYYFEWQPTRLAQGGTYLASTDFILQGPDRNSVAPGRFIVNRGLVKPKNSGEWGIGARWRPEWLEGNGTLGAYYREFSERNPTLNVFAGGGYYRALYAEDIKLYGVSFAKKLGGVSVGAELVHRERTALNRSL